jgi:hypothetical protein
MTYTVDVCASPVLEIAGGVIEFQDSGVVAVSGATQKASIAAPRLGADCDVAVWTDGLWVVLIGLEDVALYCAEPRIGWIRAAGELERLDLRDRYDPGGLHRVDFDPLPGGDLIVTHEFGAARITRPCGIVWQRAHRDLTAWHLGATQDAVWFRSEDGFFGLRIADGQPTVVQSARPDGIGRTDEP